MDHVETDGIAIQLREQNIATHRNDEAEEIAQCVEETTVKQSVTKYWEVIFSVLVEQVRERLEAIGKVTTGTKRRVFRSE